ncbi:pyridoxamine 5'-phosphate oxidase family protein [Pseudonocardia sp. GCM10023141]|uniref:pyridoxamine 5'-phosphate oxidase family protein n=1 Tax=Pseudonocardia sp. GCM10023141 TaxID=3252653 RepID=UPI00361E8CA3
MQSNELVMLDREQCIALLGSAVIGRVVFTDGALPSAQPVNFVLDGEEVVFRTSNGSKLAAATRHAVVAFEVDDIDHATRTGWSVLGVGQAYEVVEPARLAELAELQPDPWAPDRTAHTISIPLQMLSGRRLVLTEPALLPVPGATPDGRDLADPRAAGNDGGPAIGRACQTPPARPSAGSHRP